MNERSIPTVILELFVVILAVSVIIIALSRAAKSHDIYSKWRQPGTGMSCCSERDCYPTQARLLRGGWLAVRREDQQWVAVPPEVIIYQSTEDGGAYLCAPPPSQFNDRLVNVWCFVPPNSGS